MFEIYKKRPILAWSATGVVGLVLLWIFWPRGSASASSEPLGIYSGASGSSDAVSVAQIQAQSDQDALQAQLAAHAAELAVTQNLTQLGYQLQDRQGERDYAIQQQTLTASRDLGLAQLASEDSRYSINANLQDREDARATALQGYFLTTQTALQESLINTNVVNQALAVHAKRETIFGLLDRLNHAGPGGFVDPTVTG